MLKNIVNVTCKVLWIAAFGLALLVAPVQAGIYEDLLKAVEGNDRGWLERLFAEGGDPNTVDKDGNTLLMLAARDGKDNAVKALLAARAKVNNRNRLGETALMLAAMEGRTAIAKQLVFNGAQADFKGWNPLLYAAAGGKDEVVAMLVDLGANINGRAPNGATPLMMAVRGGYKGTVSLLLKRGADPNLTTDRGDTALTWAMDRGHAEIGDMLRTAGAK